ncbi:hypothetical protein [Thiomicrorhabdus sp.]|uniref:hypothetical protein n=1 Tax=Thiomicrorhabdus sp. TaxID=2039724 RepID=UPI0035648651
MKVLLMVFSLLLLSGCNNFYGFKKSDYSGIKDSQVDSELIGSNRNFNLLDSSDEFLTKLQENCLDDSQIADIQKKSGFIAPILATAIKYTFDSYIDEKTKEIEEIKKAAVRTYSSTILLNSSDLSEGKCIQIIRHKDKSTGFIALLKIEHIPKTSNAPNNKQQAVLKDSWYFKPIYVKANNSVAWASEKIDPDKPAPPKIKVSIAMSLKAIKEESNGWKSLQPVGQSVVSIPYKLVIGKSSTAKCIKNDENCNKSDLIATYPDPNKSISLTISVTETGVTGIDTDLRISELKALKAAFGPVIKDTIKDGI